MRQRQEVQALPRGLTPHGADRSRLTTLRRRQEPLRLVALLALAVFGALAVAYERDPLAALDAETSAWVARSLPSALEWAARPPSWLGGWIGITLLAVALGVVLVRERAWIDLGFLLAALAGSQIFVALLKHWFDRARPDAGSAVAIPSSASFPSAHATAGVACLGAAAVLVSERLPSHRTRASLWCFVAVCGVLVGLSRIALNVHYVTDVVAGWFLGLAWLCGCLAAREYVRDARQPASQAEL